MGKRLLKNENDKHIIALKSVAGSALKQNNGLWAVVYLASSSFLTTAA